MLGAKGGRWLCHSSPWLLIASRAVWPLSIAPMMDRTDRHRCFMRQITRRTLLYTGDDYCQCHSPR